MTSLYVLAKIHTPLSAHMESYVTVQNHSLVNNSKCLKKKRLHVEFRTMF